MSKGISLKDVTTSGSGPAAQLMKAFKAAHENVVFRTLDDMNEALQKFATALNASGRDEFLGLSPTEMGQILYGEFSFDNSLFTFLNQPAEAYDKVLIIREARQYLDFLTSAEKIKLTSTGSLPRAYVMRFYDELKDGFPFHFKPNREADLFQLMRIRILVEGIGWAKVRNGYLSLTKAGQVVCERAYSHPETLYRELFKFMVTEYNWGFNDHYGDIEIVQDSWLFGMYLLKSKATDWVSCQSLGESFEAAFPKLNPYACAQDESIRGTFRRCFELRFLQKFCLPFGLVEFSETKFLFSERLNVKVTELFDGSFHWKPMGAESSPASMVF